MTSVEDFNDRLALAARIADMLDRRIWALAVITEYLRRDGITPILVGGAAVEFYTIGGYATKDMDIILEPSPRVAEALSELGFNKNGRFYYREDIDVILETPSGPLAGDPSRAVEIAVDDMRAYVIGIEDLVIDRLNAYVHWQSIEDKRWILHLLSERQTEIDWQYLQDRSKREGTAEALAAIRREVESSK